MISRKREEPLFTKRLFLFSKKMIRQASGILPFKKQDGHLQFFLVHPGGPFWKNKDLGAWSIAKGEFDDTENALDAAIREFEEETGILPDGNFTELKPVKLKSGKTIYAWAIEQDLDANNIASNTFDIEWPPKSGKMQSFPEIDRGGWFDFEAAIEKLNPAQVSFIRELVSKIEN